MKFQDLSVRAKLMTGFCGMACIVALVSGLALHSLAGAQARFEHHVAGVGQRERLAMEVRGAAESRAIAARNLVLVSRPQDRTFEHQAIGEQHNRMQQAIAQLKQSVEAADASPTERELVAAIEEVESRYGPLAGAIVKMADDGLREQAITRMNDECRPLLRALIDAVGRYLAYEQQQVTQSRLQAQHGFQQDQATLVGGCLLAALAALALGWALSATVTGPLRRAVAVARAVAEGDLATRVAPAGRDETGQLLAALQQMAAQLGTVVGTVRSCADGVAGASGEIATGNHDLSSRTEQQASALAQTAATMQHMTAMVQDSAGHSRQASALSQAAATAAEQGGRLVQRVVSTMQEISGASGQIRQIVGVIDGIAFQTNILALNAAVEAARAGEQGRGFAVVAAEVRALAQRCASAAKQVHQLVHASQGKVEAGEALVNEAGGMMEAIVGQIREVDGLVADIHAATQQQGSGIAEINQAVASIEEGTQQNAALVEQSAAAAESLRQQAVQLVQVLSRFKVAHVH